MQTHDATADANAADGAAVAAAHDDDPTDKPTTAPGQPPAGASLHYRTVWISDLHLGTPGCQARALLDFLRRVDCDTLYLVGDIIDGWPLRRSWYWPQSHNDVVQKNPAQGPQRHPRGVCAGQPR